MSHPVLFEMNTRCALSSRSRTLGRPATLDDLPDSYLDELAGEGVTWVWLLGVWQTGTAGRQVSRNRADWRQGFRRELPDLSETDIVGSPFAVQRYEVRPELGGDEALARIRERLARRGLHLMLDFVPNHVSLDHPWLQEHPEYFVAGTEDDLIAAPQNFISLETGAGPRILAYGRDPHFSGWPDSLQLNYRHAGLRQAMLDVLLSVARRCDGVRCDMAMLLLPEVIHRTWGLLSAPADGTPPVDDPFWPEAIARVRRETPGFVLMAEVYWDLELTLQQQGFDFTYDKRLYDLLRAGEARPVREHLMAAPAFQDRSARFLENHDEPRAATTFSWPMHQAAAVISFLVPGLRFFHEGQLEGLRAFASMHLARRPVERPDLAVQTFYGRLLACLKRPELHDGSWQLLSCRPAWQGDSTWDQLIAFAWQGKAGETSLVAVNYGPRAGACYVPLPLGLAGAQWALDDLMGGPGWVLDGDELGGRGLYLAMEPWAYSVFELSRR